MKNAITTVPFHGANFIICAGDAPETTLVAMRPIVEGMGLAWKPQFTKLKTRPVLSSSVTQMVTVADDGKQREMIALPLNRLHFWLATIDSNKVSDPDVREKVILYQTEAADVLFNHFFGEALDRVGDDTSDRQFGIAKMTISKVTGIERMLSEVENRLDNLIVGVNARVAALEYVSVRELLEEAKAVQKGRRGLNRKIGHGLTSRALLAGHPSPCRRCPHSGVWLFQRDFADQYMREVGRGLVREHNAKQAGQIPLQLIGGSAHHV